MERKLKVGIVSLGLIGASILKGLYKDYDCYCYSTSMPSDAFKYSKNISNDLNIVKDCDIVFVASPISKTLEILKKLDSIVKPSCIVADCASVKNSLLGQKFNFKFILSHPMAGKEVSGFEASDTDLFKGAKWLLEKSNPILEEVIKSLGADIIYFDMEHHDASSAQISHMPTILSYLLFDIAQDDAKKIASSGFRDMTRLSAGNYQLSLDMLKYNEENILKTFNELVNKINTLKNMDEKEKEEYFKNISQKRAKMYDKSGRNIFNS